MNWCRRIGHRWVWLRVSALTNDDIYYCSRCLKQRRVSWSRYGYMVASMKQAAPDKHSKEAS